MYVNICTTGFRFDYYSQWDWTQHQYLKNNTLNGASVDVFSRTHSCDITYNINGIVVLVINCTGVREYLGVELHGIVHNGASGIVAHYLHNKLSIIKNPILDRTELYRKCEFNERESYKIHTNR